MLKMKTMKFNDIIAVTKPKYKYLKVIPHLGVKNYNSDDLVAYVNSMYRNLSKRMRKEEKKLIVESKCKLTYYIHITKQDIGFYFIVPEYHLQMIKNKIISSWGNKVNIIEVEEIPRFSNNCSKCQMNYKNVDGLSIEADKRNNDLLSSNLSVITAMQDDEAVGILYNMLPISNRQQRTWLTRYEEDFQKYKNNQSIEKITLDLPTIIKLSFISIVRAANYIVSEVQLALKENNIKIEAIDNFNLSINTNRKISNASIKKKNDTIIQTQIICMSEAKDKVQQEKLLDSVVNSFEVVKQDNELVPRPLKRDFKIEDFSYHANTLNCSNKELGSNAVVLPGSNLLTQYTSIQKNELNETELPKELQNGYIRLGINKYKKTKQMAYLNSDPSLINLPVALLGGSRSGKSTLTENHCKDIIEAGEGLIIIDFIKNTELSDNVRKITLVDRLIDIDLTDPNCYQAFSYNELKITENMSKLEKTKIANRKIIQISNLIDSINSDGVQLTGKMNRYLVSAGKLIFLKNNKTLKDVVKCLQNYKYRLQVISELDTEMKTIIEDDIDTLNELNELDKKTGEVVGTKDSKIEGILDRINIIKRDPNMNLMYDLDDKNNINFIEAMNKGKVILIRLREDEYFEKISKNVMATFFITKIWLSSLVRGKQKNVKRCTVIIDEIFQVPMAQKLVGRQLVQSAKFNLKYILTLHYMNQLTQDTKDALKSANASYVLISGCDKKVFRELEEEFTENGYELSDLLRLERFHALNLIKINKSYATFITELPPPIYDVPYETK